MWRVHLKGCAPPFTVSFVFCWPEQVHNNGLDQSICERIFHRPFLVISYGSVPHFLAAPRFGHIVTYTPMISAWYPLFIDEIYVFVMFVKMLTVIQKKCQKVLYFHDGSLMISYFSSFPTCWHLFRGCYSCLNQLNPDIPCLVGSNFHDNHDTRKIWLVLYLSAGVVEHFQGHVVPTFPDFQRVQIPS